MSRKTLKRCDHCGNETSVLDQDWITFDTSGAPLTKGVGRASESFVKESGLELDYCTLNCLVADLDKWFYPTFTQVLHKASQEVE